MCRICGRMARCIFDSMPSRVPRPSSNRNFATASAIRTSSQGEHLSSRQLIKTTFNLSTSSSSSSSSAIPPTFLLPHRSKLHQIATLQQEPTQAPQFRHTQPLIPPEDLQRSSVDSLPTVSPESTPQAPPSPPLSKQQPPPTSPLVLSKSLQSLLPALHAQPPHYITTHIHRFPYLITAGDTLRLPFHMHGVQPGDVLRFNRASLLGSRDYTLKAGTSLSAASHAAKQTNEPNYLDERLFECRVRVLGVESQPMTIKEKKKRRNRRVKKVKSKHKYTVCRVMEVRVKGLEELIAEKEVVLLE